MCVCVCDASIACPPWPPPPSPSAGLDYAPPSPRVELTVPCTEQTQHTARVGTCRAHARMKHMCAQRGHMRTHVRAVHPHAAHPGRARVCSPRTHTHGVRAHAPHTKRVLTHVQGDAHTRTCVHTHGDTRAHAPQQRGTAPRGHPARSPGNGRCGSPWEPGLRVGARGPRRELTCPGAGRWLPLEAPHPPGTLHPPANPASPWEPRIPQQTPHPPGNPTSPWELHIPLGGARRRRRSRSRGQQTNTLYSIVTTVRITVSRASAEPEPAASHPPPGRDRGPGLPLS